MLVGGKWHNFARRVQRSCLFVGKKEATDIATTHFYKLHNNAPKRVDKHNVLSWIHSLFAFNVAWLA